MQQKNAANMGILDVKVSSTPISYIFDNTQLITKKINGKICNVFFL